MGEARLPLRGSRGLEIARVLGIDPKLAGRAAAVALPAGRVAQVAPDDPGAARSIGDRAGRADIQQGRFAGLARVDRIEVQQGPEGLAGVIGKYNFPIRGPAGHQHLAAALEGQAAGLPARSRHAVDFRLAVIPAHKRDLAPIG